MKLVESLTTPTPFLCNYHYQGIIKIRNRWTIIYNSGPFFKSREMYRAFGSPRARRHASLQRDTNEIQRHKAGWLASGTHKYLDDRGLIARPRGCVRTARDAPPRLRARSLAHSRVQLQPTNSCTHPCSSDLELIRREVSCRHTGNLTEARPRKSRRKREDGRKGEKGGTACGERKRKKEIKKEERVKRDGESPTARNSYTHPVCGSRKLIQTRSFPEARFHHVTRASNSCQLFAKFLRAFRGP